MSKIQFTLGKGGYSVKHSISRQSGNEPFTVPLHAAQKKISMATVALAKELGPLQPKPLQDKVALITGDARGIMNAATGQRETDQPNLERVSGCLQDAWCLFAKGDSEQAYLCLASANSVFDSCQAEVKSEAEVTPTSRVDSTSSHLGERERIPLARAATA